VSVRSPSRTAGSSPAPSERAPSSEAALHGSHRDPAESAASSTLADAKFDAYADNYNELWANNIGASGEAPGYFLNYKLECLERAGVPVDEPLLDYGCGIGNLTSGLAARYHAVEGYDPSTKCIDVARKRCPSVRFHTQVQGIEDEHFQTVVLAGILHHVTVAQRLEVMAKVRSKLRPGGQLVIFEQNPYNPLTRKAVAECPFDDDAILVWPHEIRRLVVDSRLQLERLDYIVFFPRPLSALRWLEPRLRWCFLGAQTMTRARKPRA